MSAVALLWPLAAVPESHIQSAGAGEALQSTAHVNFKIVIPKVLYLRVEPGNTHEAGAEQVAVMSNSRNVWLTATVRTRDEHSRATRGDVVLSASARGIIAQNTVCTAGDVRPAIADRVICTVSMP
jgi:hypothetical protein